MTTEQDERDRLDATKLIRLDEMLSSVLAEVRELHLDPKAATALSAAQERALQEIIAALPAELAAELGRIRQHEPAGQTTPDELRVQQAQLVGWLEGMLQGVRVAVMLDMQDDQPSPR